MDCQLPTCPFLSANFTLVFLSWMSASESSCFVAIWCRKNGPGAKNAGGKIGISSQKFGSAKKTVFIWPTHRFMGIHAFVLISPLIYRPLFLDKNYFLPPGGAYFK